MAEGIITRRGDNLKICTVDIELSKASPSQDIAISTLDGVVKITANSATVSASVRQLVGVPLVVERVNYETPVSIKVTSGEATTAYFGYNARYVIPQGDCSITINCE